MAEAPGTIWAQEWKGEPGQMRMAFLRMGFDSRLTAIFARTEGMRGAEERFLASLGMTGLGQRALA